MNKEIDEADDQLWGDAPPRDPIDAANREADPFYDGDLSPCKQHGKADYCAVYEMERNAEMAVERYYESRGEDTDRDRYEEAMDVGLQWMREQSGRA